MQNLLASQTPSQPDPPLTRVLPRPARSHAGGRALALAPRSRQGLTSLCRARRRLFLPRCVMPGFDTAIFFGAPENAERAGGIIAVPVKTQPAGTLHLARANVDQTRPRGGLESIAREQYVLDAVPGNRPVGHNHRRRLATGSRTDRYIIILYGGVANAAP